MVVNLGSSDPPPGYQGASMRHLLQDGMARAVSGVIQYLPIWLTLQNGKSERLLFWKGSSIQRFSISPLHPPPALASSLSAPAPDGTFATTDEPTLTRPHHPMSIICIESKGPLLVVSHWVVLLPENSLWPTYFSLHHHLTCNHWCFYCLHHFPFSRTSTYVWNHMVYTQPLHIGLLHLIICI